MSTIIHTPHKHDTALDLYADGISSAYYLAYGYYGRENFMELARRIGLVETRAAKILDQFAKREDEITELINTSFLSAEVKNLYLSCFADKLKRMLQADK